LQQNFGFLSVPPPPEDQLEVMTLQQDSEQRGESGFPEPQETDSLTAEQPSTSANTSTKDKLKKLLFWQKKAAQISATATTNVDSNFSIGDSDTESV
jgi:hypothetical protein